MHATLCSVCKIPIDSTVQSMVNLNWGVVRITGHDSFVALDDKDAEQLMPFLSCTLFGAREEGPHVSASVWWSRTGESQHEVYFCSAACFRTAADCIATFFERCERERSFEHHRNIPVVEL